MEQATQQSEDLEVRAQDATAVTAAEDEQLVAGELLVEDVSIDGMCGVY